MRNVFRLFACFSLAALAGGFTACSSSESNGAPCTTDPQSGCGAGLACENVEGGTTACFAPVYVTGKVTSSATGSGVAGARIVARDVNGAIVSSDVAISGDGGSYQLAIPATRKADGTPSLPAFTLRADASSYATFPSGLRIALPVDVSAPAKQADGSWIVTNASTALALDPLPNASGLGTIQGTVQGTSVAGVLVVAAGASGITGRDGSFTVFNVPAGAQTVSAYAQGSNWTPANATVADGQTTKDVVLASAGAAVASVTGDLQLVNPSSGSGATTSVVLVVESTFNAGLGRGEVPKGLRAANVGGAFTIANVPNGTYVVLAAFENDGWVRDPDTSIGGTATQKVTVSGANAAAGSFKITGALDVRSPGANGPEPVSGTPSFVWADDSSEDHYEVFVFDGFGNEVWENLAVPGVSGAKDVSAQYGGPPLKAGGYYQFRAISIGKNGGKRLSMTEDLKGVFLYQ